jgi:PRC-barrel domain
MTTTNNLQDVEGRTAVDANGAKLGKIRQVYVYNRTGRALWVTVSTGMFGTKESFAPLYGSRPDGDTLRLAVTKDVVKDAPGVETDGHIADHESEALYTYYERYLGDSAQYAPARDEGHGYVGDSREDLAGRNGLKGRDSSGPAADDVMTRPEER